ncbi:methionine import ATP-binding protein MetN [Campylobacter sputorum subsp. bubulus]|uniref:Methionine import ATP-binding protein MetN n=2 Tax=Campylobacter sputorum TaxID=206 RepID=A0A381DJR9_9BACT|nr:lipid asymmetry ABC transporter MlaABCDEF, ATPase component MlaF [Campylobacter sputorum aubsp. sputorum RM3237]ASM35951.1 lipid asymmetry ABC transporter MlaABCDEF, ATPase component MlaF [Campylobacter sputorum bv. faecalis CCUG 20703]ASM37635.1 lipid asymmetry ABC transporter MlaABCDEF, ATPase component MlaF [Campylobacter sputorum bv. paraureolyticus LMG 11764]QEL04479.1 lipid asymmetry ABC transporter MlaABCDEF, ATPase component MlaF [Campylobacter sputorum subsp. sputorum]SUX09253.1 met
MSENIIEAKNLTVAYGERIMQDSVNFSVKKAEIYGFLGGSGSGKTTLMKTLFYLKEPKSGVVKIFDKDIWALDDNDRMELKLKCGVMFQFGALYSSMNILDNIGVLLREHSKIPNKIIDEISMFWLQKVGLDKQTATLYPSQLSGGMKKRASLARALVLSPQILFLDEPNSGLDPMSARGFDRLICDLRDSLGITVVMVTHDIDSIFGILDRFLIIENKKIIFEGNVEEVKDLKNNPLEDLFSMRDKNYGK